MTSSFRSEAEKPLPLSRDKHGLPVMSEGISKVLCNNLGTRAKRLACRPVYLADMSGKVLQDFHSFSQVSYRFPNFLLVFLEFSQISMDLLCFS